MKTKTNGSDQVALNTALIKTLPRMGAAEIRRHLSADLAMLGRTAKISKGAASLTQELITIAAQRRTALVRVGHDDFEVTQGMTLAALLTALASGMSRKQFAGWLRLMAATIDHRPTT